MKVSIIIPTYNRPLFLFTAIKSVLAQTYQDIECIVVNDGGKSVKHVVNSFRDSRIKLIDAEHGEVSRARNHGLFQAQGDIIGFLDDDDRLLPNHVDELLKSLINRGWPITYSDARRVHLQNTGPGFYHEVGVDYPYSQDFDRDLLLSQNFIPTPCLLIKRFCFNPHPLVHYKFDDTLSVYEDWDMWLKLTKDFEVQHVKIVTCEYTWHTDGTSKSSTSNEFTTLLPLIYARYPTDNQVVLQTRKAILTARGL